MKIMNNNIGVYIIDSEGFINLRENHSEIWDNFLKQIAVLRWGYDENNLDSRINTLKNNLLDFTSFITFAEKEQRVSQNNKSLAYNNVIGFAYFCQDENDEKQWYYGGLAVHAKYRRLGIFRRLVIHRHKQTGQLITYIHPQIAESMIEMAMLELKSRKASKLFTYIEKDNKSSILLHKKFGFIPSENQENINGFEKNNRIVYEYIV